MKRGRYKKRKIDWDSEEERKAYTQRISRERYWNNREECLVKIKERYWKNRDKLLVYSKEYNKTHKEEAKQWRIKNRDKIREYQRRNTLKKKTPYFCKVCGESIDGKGGRLYCSVCLVGKEKAWAKICSNKVRKRFICADCGSEAFFNDFSKKYGVCKSCLMKQVEKDIKTKSLERSLNKQWHPMNIRLLNKGYRQKEDVKLKKKQWAREYYSNSERGKIKKKGYKQKRRAKRHDIVEAFTDEEWLAKKSDTFGVCPGCGKYIGIGNMTKDHIFPLSKAEPGRIYTINDVQALCKSCNSKKHNKI